MICGSAVIHQQSSRRIAKGKGPLFDTSIPNVMDDPYDLVLCLFVLVIAAVMLVAGELYLVNRPDPSAVNTASPRVIGLSIK